MTDTAHSPYFFKYLTAPAAIATITNLTTRWSSPRLFNDPFDMPLRIGFGFPFEIVPVATRTRLLDLAQSDDPIPSTLPAHFAAAVQSARSSRRDGVVQDLTPLVAASEQAGRDAHEHMIKWTAMWEVLLDVSRVLCVTDVHDDLLMWAHYADCHRGAMFGLRKDVMKQIQPYTAIPIEYSHKIPTLADTIDDWLGYTFDERPLDESRMIHLARYTKSAHWAYEKEWRCYTQDLNALKPEAPDPYVSYYELPEAMVDAIYLGCRMSVEHEREICRLAAQRLPNARIFRARRSAGEFRLDFDRILVIPPTGQTP